MSQLKWSENFTENDGRFWEAASIYEYDGSFFMFEITEDDGVFYETSALEIQASPARSWPTLAAAQAAMQADHEQMIKDEEDTD